MSSNPYQGLRHKQPEHCQRLLRALLVNNGAAVDASDTGVGKTAVALIIARIIGCVPLVLGPKGTRSGWEDLSKLLDVPIQFINYEKARIDTVPHECPECGRRRSWSPKELKQFGAPPCQNAECIRYNLPMTPEPVDRFGYEQPHGSGSYWVWNIKPAMMIFDEAHLCGGSTSKTGKMLRSSKQAAQYVLALSATIADNPMQLKNLGRVLGLFDGPGYYKWLQRHGVRPDFTGNMAWAKIHLTLFPSRGARLRRSDIPGFPATMIDTLLLDPETDVSESSDLLGSEGMSDLAARMAARQVLELEIVEQLASSILTSIANNCRVVVFLNFRNALDKLAAWAKKKKIPHGIIDGRQSGEKGDIERREVIRRAQSNEDKLTIVNTMAGGAGLNLHDPQGVVEVDVYAVPPESGRQAKQLTGRVHRDGAAFSRQFFCGLKGTIQEDNLQRNREKIRCIDTLNGDELDKLIFV